MSKCKNCGKSINYMTYYCSKCKKKLAGEKPKKSKKLCFGCSQDWYNKNKKNGCYSYRGSKVVIKNTYHSLNQVIPEPKWALSCFQKQYNK